MVCWQLVSLKLPLNRQVTSFVQMITSSFWLSRLVRCDLLLFSWLLVSRNSEGSLESVTLLTCWVQILQIWVSSSFSFFFFFFLSLDIRTKSRGAEPFPACQEVTWHCGGGGEVTQGGVPALTCKNCRYSSANMALLCTQPLLLI